jgi:hypothetical protein
MAFLRNRIVQFLAAGVTCLPIVDQKRPDDRQSPRTGPRWRSVTFRASAQIGRAQAPILHMQRVSILREVIGK